MAFTVRVNALRSGESLRGASPWAAAGSVACSFGASAGGLYDIVPGSGNVATTFTATATASSNLSPIGNVSATFTASGVPTDTVPTTGTVSGTFAATGTVGESYQAQATLTAFFEATGVLTGETTSSGALITIFEVGAEITNPASIPALIFVAQGAGAIDTAPPVFQMLTTSTWPLGFDVTALLANVDDGIFNPSVTVFDVQANEPLPNFESSPSVVGNVIVQVFEGSLMANNHKYRVTVTFESNVETYPSFQLMIQASPAP